MESLPTINTPAKISHRELLGVDGDRAALPQVLERVLLWMDADDPWNDGHAEDDYARAWDDLYDEIENDRERACDLDEEGVSYRLPDGREIAATRIDVGQLEEITDGYIECALWSDCMPEDRCQWCETAVHFEDDAWIHSDSGKRVCGQMSGDSIERFAERDENAESGGKEHLEPDDELRERCRLDCAAFMAMVDGDLEMHDTACEIGERAGFDPSQGTPAEFFGHDLWLTKRGHGTGFWDRELGPLGDRLTKAAERLGALVPEFYPYDKGDETAGLS